MFLAIIFLWLEILGNAVSTSMAPVFWSKDRGLLFSWTDSLFYYNALFRADLFLCHQDLLFNFRDTEIHLGERNMCVPTGEEHLLKKEVTFKLIIMMSMVIFYLISNRSTCIGYSSLLINPNQKGKTNLPKTWKYTYRYLHTQIPSKMLTVKNSLKYCFTKIYCFPFSVLFIYRTELLCLHNENLNSCLFFPHSHT